MRPFTNEETQAIVAACHVVIKAYESRHADANQMTLNEAQAVNALKYELAAREREALVTAMGTAA
jgi:hypothetical protein